MRTLGWVCGIASLVLALFLAGCTVALPSGDIVEIPMDEYVPPMPAVTTATGTGPESEPIQFLTPALGSSADAEHSAEAAAKPEPLLFSLLPVSEGEPLRARDLFAEVSPAVAYISTPHGTGSAVLVDYGYLVTAAHVVWPYERVRAVFADGTEFEDLPVAAWDLMLDVALLGPVETAIESLTFADGTDLPVGSEVYIIGYPAEVETYPQPALGRGLLSRTREWETTGLTMLQVDADISGGQSGGALVSEQGELIGITKYRFSDSFSPMVTSAEDVVPCLNAMLAGEPQTLADRRPIALEASYTYEGVLEDEYAYDYYLLVAEAGDEVEVDVEGAGTPVIAVVSIRGEPLDSSMPRAESMSGVATTVWNRGPYIVEVTQYSANRNHYGLTSSHPLFAIEDPDNGRQIHFGDVYTGNIDNPGDSDVFTVYLRAGNKLVLQVESLAIDPEVYVVYNSRAREDLVYDDDSGPAGIFGLNARAVFVASEEGEYTVVISDASRASVGGYILEVSEGKSYDPVTETSMSLDHYLTSHGLFSRYESAGFPFTLLYPAGFTYDFGLECEDWTMCLASETGYLFILEASPSELATSQRDPDQMLKLMRMGAESTYDDIQGLSRRTITTTQGRDGRMESITAYDATSYIASFASFSEDIGMFAGMFAVNLAADTNLEALEEYVAFLFSTFHVDDATYRANDPAIYLEQGMVQAAKGYYRQALANLSFAIMLDGKLVEAYALRAAIHTNMGDYDEALTDLEAALALEPDNVAFLEDRAFLYWYQGDYEQALASSDRVVELRPKSAGLYSNRAICRATAGDYDGALEDLAQYEEMVQDDMPPYVLNTRAYVHLRSGAVEEARADYDEALAADYQTPATLLGAGVTYARLGLMEEALPLLEYGMEQLEEAEYEVVDPQLADVLAMAQEILAVKQAK